APPPARFRGQVCRRRSCPSGNSGADGGDYVVARIVNVIDLLACGDIACPVFVFVMGGKFSPLNGCRAASVLREILVSTAWTEGGLVVKFMDNHSLERPIGQPDLPQLSVFATTGGWRLACSGSAVRSAKEATWRAASAEGKGRDSSQNCGDLEWPLARPASRERPTLRIGAQANGTVAGASRRALAR